MLPGPTGGVSDLVSRHGALISTIMTECVYFTLVRIRWSKYLLHFKGLWASGRPFWPTTTTPATLRARRWVFKSIKNSWDSERFKNNVVSKVFYMDMTVTNNFHCDQVEGVKDRLRAPSNNSLVSQHSEPVLQHSEPVNLTPAASRMPATTAFCLVNFLNEEINGGKAAQNLSKQLRAAQNWQKQLRGSKQTKM